MTIEWREDRRPNEAESKFNIHGVRGHLNGATTEVRLFDTVRDGLHIFWSVGRPGDELFVEGKIHCDCNNSGQIVSAYERGKELAEMFARCWKHPNHLRAV